MDKKMKLIIKAIEEIIEDSNTISDIRNNLFDIEERQKYDHDDAIEQISQGVNDLQYDIQDDIDSLQQQIDELKDAIEDLKEKANG
tara:strand:+ start:1291 stop:1548 length:258 start_codon:yes stop_codon:yes gene_type:complete